MKIYWGFRLGIDCAIFWLFFEFFSNYPVLYYRMAKMEPVRWTQRRRTYINNPYMTDQSQWKLKYNEKFEAIGA